MEQMNIQIAGFKNIDASAMQEVSRLIATYSRKIGEVAKKPQMLTVKLKEVHKRPKSEIYEVHCMLLDKGKKFNSTTLDRNLLIAVDIGLQKLDSEIRDTHHSGSHQGKRGRNTASKEDI